MQGAQINLHFIQKMNIYVPTIAEGILQSIIHCLTEIRI